MYFSNGNLPVHKFGRSHFNKIKRGEKIEQTLLWLRLFKFSSSTMFEASLNDLGGELVGEACIREPLGFFQPCENALALLQATFKYGSMPEADKD